MSVHVDQDATRDANGAAPPPNHVAIIMDGNGRWAMARGLPRGEGHRRGVEAVREVVRAAIELGIPWLTLFSFSSENWSRPREEVDFLFGLFRRYIRRDVAELHAAGVRIDVIGKREGLPADVLGMIEDAENLTTGNTALRLVFAFNYGGRDEIARAARKIAQAIRDGTLDPEAVDERTVFVPLYWPDFDRAALAGALDEFARRSRRYGGTVARSSP
jgi:undecaprenyl diphosphate synthase